MKRSSKPSKRAEKPRLSDLAVKATWALARAQREVVRENARYGLPLIVVENGRVVAIPTGKVA